MILQNKMYLLRYGRDPTDQQRAWLENKVRTDIAMRATKLNAQVQLTNLQAMYEKGKATSDQRRQLELEYQMMTQHADPRMRLQGFLDLSTEKGAAFERAWEWCQQSK